MGYRASKFMFNLMGNSLLSLHALAKFPEIKRNYFSAIIFINFKGFSLINGELN